MTGRKLILYSALLLALAVVPASAQIIIEGELTHQQEIERGKVYRGTLLVKNIDREPQEVKLYQTDYFFFADGRIFYEEVGTVDRTNGKWIEFFPKRFSVPAAGSVQVNYTVTVPDDENLVGTYWSVLMVEGIPKGSPESSDQSSANENVGVGIRQVFRYGVQMVTHIEGDGAGVPKITAARLLKENEQRALQLDVTNQGERWLRPTVYAELYDTDGNYRGRYEGERLRIYPGTSVRFTIDLKEAPAGTFKALVVLDGGDDGVFGANYTLSLE